MTPTTPTRLAALPVWSARMILLLAAALALSTVVGPRQPRPAPAAAGPAAHYADRELYREVTAKVSAGQDYYAAADATQRAHGYPTAPAWAFREPTEAWLLALLRGEVVRWAALLMLAATAVAAMRAAADQAPGPAWRRIAVTLLFGLGLAIVGVPTAPYLHENWAAALIGLSLACWRPGRWRLAMACGLLACLFREIAAPYLMVMAGFAALERRRGELVGWTAALAVLAAALGAHALLAGRQHLVGDGLSPGWVRLGGWPFAVLAAQRNVVLAVLPGPAASLVLTAALLGLAGTRSAWLQRIAGVLGAFLLAFTAVGRPDNYYWGMMIAPLAVMGLAYAPEAVGDLWRAAWPRSAAAEGEADGLAPASLARLWRRRAGGW